MKWWQIGLIILVVFGAAFGLYKIAATPVPGVHKEEQGREHVPAEEVAKFSYNSNPPTSGRHLETWVKPGIYATPQSEGELIHSLEHGYVVIHYNCNVHLSRIFNSQFSIFNQFSMFQIPNVYAHEEGTSSAKASAGDGSATPSADFRDSTVSTASAINDTQACKDLVKKLGDLATANRLWKLIVVPRPQMDTTIALTAWKYIDKFDQFDEARIKKFIDYHRDHGPEKTME